MPKRRPNKKRRRATPRKAAGGREKIHPCIWYAQHNVYEVAELYTTIFPYSRILSVVTSEDQYPPDDTLEKITEARVVLLGEYFLLTQAEGEDLEFSPAVSLTVECADPDELEGYRNAFLKAGAEPLAPNWIIDPFGFYWHFNQYPHPKPQIIPCIWHAGRHAGEMADFYIDVFSGSRTGRSISPEDAPPDNPIDNMSMVEFTLFDRLFRVVQAPADIRHNDAFTLTVMCEDQQEIDRYWDALVKAGATPKVCGWLTDHLGFGWHILPTMLDPLLATADPESARRIQHKILTTAKLDIAELEAAARG